MKKRLFIILFFIIILLLGMRVWQITGRVITKNYSWSWLVFWPVIVFILGLLIIKMAAAELSPEEKLIRKIKRFRVLEAIQQEHANPLYGGLTREQRERLSPEERPMDITQEHRKLYAAHSTSRHAEIYATSIPEVYCGLRIDERKVLGDNPVIKLFFESSSYQKGNKVSDAEIAEAFDRILDKIPEYGFSVIAPTINKVLATYLRSAAKKHPDLILEERPGTDMSQGLFEYVYDDLQTKKEKGLKVPKDISENPKDWTYFVIRIKSREKKLEEPPPRPGLGSRLLRLLRS